jgi:deoxyribodipyrimidine photolyase-related protein
VSHTALVLGDQLSHANPALEGADRVLLVESRAALGHLPYHRQRRHLVLSAMRHFAADLREQGREVVYERDAPSIAAVLPRGEVRCAEPNARAGRTRLAARGVELVPSAQFLGGFAAWASGRRRLVMEDFYREQRRTHGLLLDEHGGPEGGRWNFDEDNRRPPAEGLTAPAPWLPEEDAIDAEVRRDLDRMRLPEFGADGPRLWPATAAEARAALEDFVAHRLAGFGPWQDAMVEGERWLFHSRLSSSLNLWLLDPLEACRAAEAAFRAGDVPLQSAEGFIRQIAGWREYVWGMYWQHDFRADDALRADRPLPAAFETGETDAACLRAALGDVRETAYAHHIQRLMVLGNLMLLLGVRPWEAVQWFHGSFIDGAEWVMAPNVAGMATYADGGRMMTMPYAAGGNYIDRMSDHCGNCRYSPRRDCPVTALYWDFIARNRERLAGNRRMAMPLRALARMDPEALAQRRARAAAFADAL